MGSNQSSHINMNTSSSEDVRCENMRGRKIMKKNVALSVDDSDVTVENNAGSLLTFEEAVLVDICVSLKETDWEESLDGDFSSDDEEADEEFDKILSERLRILADARKLKHLANAFLHPEAPVEADPEIFGRNYFTLPSASKQESAKDSKERSQILADANALKTPAKNYLHPEIPVVTNDATACGRNYFTRVSAPQQETIEDAAEHAQILAEAAALKKLAVDYIHPELPVVTSDAACYGRNYFTRASAPEQESMEEVEQHDQVLADASSFKKFAVDFLHPELPVGASLDRAANMNSKLAAVHHKDEEVKSPSAVMLSGLENQSF